MINSGIDNSLADLFHRLSAKMTDNKQNAIDFEAEDFDAVEQAVLETERGRWFLAEYAARNRRSETSSLLTSLTKLEKAISSELQFMNNSTEGFRSHQRLAYEFETLIKAVGLSNESKVDPIASLAHQMSSNSFALAQLADEIRDRIDEVALVDLPAETVIKLGQATQKIVTLTAHQNKLSRHVEALAKIISYIKDRLENSYPATESADRQELSASLSIASFDQLRETVAAFEKDD
jgi:outer membrane murein-binding lipoprotein Lpp